MSLSKKLKNICFAEKAGKQGGKEYTMKKREKHQVVLVALLVVLVIILDVLIYARHMAANPAAPAAPAATETAAVTESPKPEESKAPKATEEKEDEKDTEKLAEFNPQATENTLPSNLIQYTEVSVNGELTSNYKAASPIDFGLGKDYTDVQGIVTFRGNNFRDGGSYGTASLTEKKLGDSWNVPTGALSAPDGQCWTGSGWVGQPLMMTWPKKLREKMNMYDWAKQEKNLTEVIYATMDGNIYFLDLATGEKTRDPMYLGYTFKGAGALDPRGYPIMYLGSGYDSMNGKSRAFIINLIDCSVMHTFGDMDPFNLRGTLSFFDGSALVDAETDQLIYPGESGILYITKLNTQYDPDAGTLSIAPDAPVKWHYYGNRSGAWYMGMEDSAVTWRGHIFFATNDGYLFCLNLNTLETVWVQDTVDDTNCSPVLELEDGHPYIYISTSFHLGWRSSGTVDVPVWKIDAVNGEIVWKNSYTCYSVTGVSGGVQGTMAVGKHKLSDLVFVPVARTPDAAGGRLIALNKKTGEEVWDFPTQVYSWSSPTAVYDKDGNGYLLYCTSGGYLYLLDGLTGEVLDSRDLGSNIEASPAVYENTVVVGTRGQQIYGIQLK